MAKLGARALKKLGGTLCAPQPQQGLRRQSAQGKAGSQSAKAACLYAVLTAAPVGATAPMRASSPASRSIVAG